MLSFSCQHQKWAVLSWVFLLRFLFFVFFLKKELPMTVMGNWEIIFSFILFLPTFSQSWQIIFDNTVDIFYKLFYQSKFFIQPNKECQSSIFHLWMNHNLSLSKNLYLDISLSKKLDSFLFLSINFKYLFHWRLSKIIVPSPPFLAPFLLCLKISVLYLSWFMHLCVSVFLHDSHPIACLTLDFFLQWYSLITMTCLLMTFWIGINFRLY